jgi:type IV secretion system protein VirB10
LPNGGRASASCATLWLLQPSKRRAANDPTELYNVDRVSRSEGLDRLLGVLSFQQSACERCAGADG